MVYLLEQIKIAPSSWYLGFPGSSDGKEATCNTGNSGSIHGLGSSPGEGIGYPLQYFGASLVVQMVKSLPVMRETWVPSLGWEESLEVGMATYSSILAWRIPMDRGAWWATVHWVAKSQTQMSMLSTMVVLFLIFWGISIIYSIVVVPIYFPHVRVSFYPHPCQRL